MLFTNMLAICPHIEKRLWICVLASQANTPLLFDNDSARQVLGKFTKFVNNKIEHNLW